MDNLPYSSSEIHAGVLDDDPLICAWLHRHLQQEHAAYVYKWNNHLQAHYWEGFNDGFLTFFSLVKTKKYEETGKIMHYAARVLKYAISNYLRQMKIPFDFPEELPIKKMTNTTPKEVVLYSTEEDEIAHTFEIAGTYQLFDWYSKLPPQKSKIIRMTHEGKKAREIGEELNMSTSNVTTNLQRLRKKMRSLLNGF